MRTIYFLLCIICMMTSCKSAIDKSISESLSSEEMVSICKGHDIPKIEYVISTLGSENSLYRELDESFLIKYSDLTYRDIIEYWGMINDSVKIKDFDKKYDEYEKETLDSIWKKLIDIRESIKKDTSFNKYAKLHYEQENVKSILNGKTFKSLSMQVDSYDKDIDALGGVVSKVSKDGASDPTVNFYYFEVGKRSSDVVVKRNPTLGENASDYYSGEYDYSINILWARKGYETFYTSKDLWDNLVRNSTKSSNTSIFVYTRDMVFSKSSIKKDEQLLKITNSKIQSRKEFRDSLFNEQMTEKNLRAKRVIGSIFPNRK